MTQFGWEYGCFYHQITVGLSDDAKKRAIVSFLMAKIKVWHALCAKRPNTHCVLGVWISPVGFP